MRWYEKVGKKLFERVWIVSKYDVREIKEKLKKFGFNVTRKNPEMVICYGGDGTILYAERIFPGIPKLVIKRDSSICRKCDYTPQNLLSILERLKEGKYKIKEEMKLEGIAKNRKLIGLNEIQIHNKLPIRAIRFTLEVLNRRIYAIGDGVIISTPFGSTGYYKAAGGKKFERGIGICFNNPHPREIKSFVVPDDSEIRVRIEKEEAYLLADNYERFISLKEGDETIIRKTEGKARFILMK